MALESGFNQGQANERATQNASENLAQEARALHECWPGGPIVSSRKECWDIDRKGLNQSEPNILPSLQLTDNSSRR